MRAASRVVRPGLVSDEDDLVPRVGEQRQQALPLEVEAVRRAADFGRPEEAELALGGSA